jgi:hypothetical protein
MRRRHSPRFFPVSRKAFGSAICQQAGIHQAGRSLRHSDIRVTSQVYVDSKSRYRSALVIFWRPTRLSSSSNRRSRQQPTAKSRGFRLSLLLCLVFFAAFAAMALFLAVAKPPNRPAARIFSLSRFDAPVPLRPCIEALSRRISRAAKRLH